MIRLALCTLLAGLLFVLPERCWSQEPNPADNPPTIPNREPSQGADAPEGDAQASESAASDSQASDSAQSESADSGSAEQTSPAGTAPGSAKLGEAIEQKLNARSLGDLERVVTLCEEALAAGLDSAESKIAHDMIAYTLYERAARLSREILDREQPDRRWPALRNLALTDLQKSLTHNPALGAAHLLIARLQVLPNGDRDAARQAVDKALELIKDDDTLRAQAHVVRGTISEDPQQRMEDFNKAIELDPSNMDAWRGRGLLYSEQGDNEKALDDLLELLERTPDDLVAHQAVAELLARLEKYDEALEHVGQVIERVPNAPFPYIIRARIHMVQENYDSAIEDLNRALELEPTDVNALLLRAMARSEKEEYEAARADLARALEINPNFYQAILQRSLILAAEEKYGQAIQDLERLLQINPKNSVLRLQLGFLYVSDHRPRRATEVFTELLADEPDNWRALRSRGDAYLSIGKQAEAIADYERALKINPDDPGILNNLAWVLATSPRDELRDGKRAIELATKACEVTEYEAAHILSTLAAGYAETGDFETAVKWSEKAVEIGEEQREQLEQELESYRQRKPWRELQTVEETPEPEQPSDADLELK